MANSRTPKTNSIADEQSGSPPMPYYWRHFSDKDMRAHMEESFERFSEMLRTSEGPVFGALNHSAALAVNEFMLVCLSYHTARSREPPGQQHRSRQRLRRVEALADELYKLVHGNHSNRTQRIKEDATVMSDANGLAEMREAETTDEEQRDFQRHLIFALSLSPPRHPKSIGHSRLRSLDSVLKQLLEACTLERKLLVKTGPHRDTTLPFTCQKIYNILLNLFSQRVARNFTILPDGKFQKSDMEDFYNIIQCIDAAITRSQFKSAASGALKGEHPHSSPARV